MTEVNISHIMGEEWDYLIILDACRYDYFEKTWKKYLPKGHLSCRQSIGSSTNEWRNKTFSGYYEDVVYISSNPYINSVHSVQGFDSKTHLPNIIDVWATGWNPKIGTVPPKAVTKETLKVIEQFPGKRFIIHYLQPHAPYLGFGSDCIGFAVPNVKTGTVFMETTLPHMSYPVRQMLFSLLLPLFQKYFKGNGAWFLTQMLGLPPLTPMDAVRQKYGAKGLRKAYEENLEIVLREVSNLLRFLKGKIVITSDHGEFLGENRAYSHYPGSLSPFLRQVPWFVLEKDKAELIPKHKTQAINDLHGTSNQIEERLKALGYL